MKMEIKKVLWLEDQRDDLNAYISGIIRAGYKVDPVRSVTEVVNKLRQEEYIAVIFDIKVLPGNDPGWITLDKKLRDEKPDYDSALGLELLYALFKSDLAKININLPKRIDPGKVIVFTAVNDIIQEVGMLGIPDEQIVYKADSDLNTLPRLINEIKEREQKRAGTL